MSCIITYKGKKYSEEQFKEYFINNKNEFATSISKNKDVIDSFKRKMEGIDFVFSQSPELASIGSKSQYLQYLSTIFKTSKVKDIVYHGTGKKDWRPFKGKNFFTDLNSATNYANVIASEDLEFTGKIGETKIISVLLNSNPEIVNKTLSIEEIDNYKTSSDGIIANVKEPIGLQKQYVVFEPEQIHILSSKADIQGFKDFTQGKQFQKLTAEEKARTMEQITKEHRSIAALKDLSAKLAHRIGGKVEFVNRTDVDWKGYNQGMTSVLNEAYMDESTAIHEIMGHPIIRALKSISSQKESVTLQQMINNQEIEKICS